MDTQTRVLITGGAGFIGSHLADLLADNGYHVTLLDSLVPQVHLDGAWPDYTDRHGSLNRITADVRHRGILVDVLRTIRPQVVVHLAAEVGVGQAEYEIERYVDVNVNGTASLLQAILQANDDATTANGIGRLVVAGSMSSYGEGMWQCPVHGPMRPGRAAADLIGGDWIPRCIEPECRAALECVPIPEWSSLRPAGVYALTKRDQEELALLVARSRGLSTAVARFFNVYGPRQQPSNPYTGVAAIFGSCARRGVSPQVYEDGLQVRDFIHVSDVVKALAVLIGDRHRGLAQRSWASAAYHGVFNVGTGYPTTILQVAKMACAVLARDIEPEVTGQYRVGDVRACIGDRERMRNLGWEPQVRPEAGLRELFATYAALDLPTPPDAQGELLTRGLLHRAIIEDPTLPTGDPTLDDGTPERADPAATTGWVDPLSYMPGVDSPVPIDTDGGVQ